MAKILLCFSSHIYVDGKFRLISYYEGLIKELTKNNNDVMICNSAEFLKKSWNSDNELSGMLKQEQIKKDVESFCPDLVISFNNSKLSFIEEICDCPIAIWEADSFSFYNDKDRIKKDPNRYLYFCLSRNVADQILDVGAKSKNVFIIKSGTAIESEDVEISTNISFIGSNFSGPKSLVKLLNNHNTKQVKSAVQHLASNFYVEPEQYLKEQNLEYILDYMKVDDFANINSCQHRIDTLNVIKEFGLDLYGNTSWYNTVQSSPQLALAFNPRPVYSLKHNQDIYNASRLCLNVSHIQAVDGFSWRVMDIMASNGCLFTNYNSGIENFTRGYLDLPMYKSSGEAYELARRLLKDESFRHDLVEASQACIEDKGRWCHRFKEIEEATGLNILSETTIAGKAIYLHRDEYITEIYKKYVSLLLLAAKLTPKQTHSILYNVATALGFKIDYHLVKSVMERDHV